MTTGRTILLWVVLVGVVLTVGVWTNQPEPTNEGAGPSLLEVQQREAEWDLLNQESLELYRTGEYDRAVVVTKKALEVAEKNIGPDHPDVAESLNNLALLYRIQGQYAQAEPLYQRSLAIWEKALGPDLF